MEDRLTQWKTLLIRVGFVLLIVLFYRCPVRAIFGVDCPGCGMTRACLSALRLDFRSAFAYHPLFWLFGIELVYVLLRDQIKRFAPISPKVESVAFIVSMILLVIVWGFRDFII